MPNILITNDDGIFSPGIRKLVDLAKGLGEITVVAPDSPRSGASHSYSATAELPICLRPDDRFDLIKSYRCSGTPVDCVKIATERIFEDKGIDIVLSGINHGQNLATSIRYSGTVGAAMEASLKGIPSIAFSLCDDHHDAKMDHLDSWIVKLVSRVLGKEFSRNVALNVNLPVFHPEGVRGIRFCRQASSTWQDHYQVSSDPQGVESLVFRGEFHPHRDHPDNDDTAVLDRYVAVVPCMHDYTDYSILEEMKLRSKEWVTADL